MSGRMTCGMLAVGLAAMALTGGCAPAAIERSQRLQVAAMVQYRDEMAAYHEKTRSRFLTDKQRELDAALEASLHQSADGDSRVTVAVAMEKLQKRERLEQTFRENLRGLDDQFAQRRAAISRAIELGRATLGLLEDYSRLGALVRSLFVREIEADQLVGSYGDERTDSHAGSGSEPEAGGR